MGKPGSDMRKLIWSFTIPVVVFVILIVGYFTVDAIVSVNHDARQTRKLFVEQTVQSYRRMGENFSTMNFSRDLLKIFDQELIQSLLKGNEEPLNKIILNLSYVASPSQFVGVAKDGKVVDYIAKTGVKVNPKELLTSPPDKGYTLMDTFGGVKGNMLYVFYPIDLTKIGLNSKIYMSTVYDITKQVKEIEAYFTNRRNDTILKMAIGSCVAIIAFFLLSTFWLSYLIHKYVSKPIEELNTTAEQMVEGTFEGEVEVDPDSDFAALQGLLKSGQLILRKYDEQRGDPGDG